MNFWLGESFWGKTILADVPMYRKIASKRSFPAVLPWQKNAMIFDSPGP